MFKDNGSMLPCLLKREVFVIHFDAFYIFIGSKYNLEIKI